ncbi:RagB/SusD family nutrient uptake outer membrane protein [Mucilaginibacter sp.]|jgi:hypothetical protein|uniref:RagB/SusD family nutrient uptake outer membrane protein n=1 Tax=Mucilaginibacter sp. TaxID=1882438 RepID=UPI0035665B5C
MKTKQLIISYLLVSILSITLASCKKSFLDLTPQGIVPVTTYYNTEVDIRTALNGAYTSLRPIYNFQWAYCEIPSDNTQSYGDSDANIGELDKFTWTSASGTLQNVWNRHYATIAYCNIVLGHVATPPMTQAARDGYIGQAKFIRALMYFNLVRMFGGVPLVLTEITTEQQAYTYERSPVADVYAQMEKDLAEAAALLPASYGGTDMGRATSIAARGLLGKVQLFQHKFQQAEPILASVVASVSLPLLSYDQVFGLSKDNNKEFIFSVQYLGGGLGEGNLFASQFIPVPATGIISVSGVSFNLGTPDLYNAFEPGDNRLNYIGTFTAGTIAYYYCKKFVYPTVPSGNEGDNDWPILRYSDAILMYAEALNENGKTADALTQLNIIRNRSSLPSKNGLSQADARIAIRNERRVELCFEGERWFDLIRYGTFVQVMQAYKDKYTPPSSSFANVLPTLNLFPIPRRETTLNSKLTQNPGY